MKWFALLLCPMLGLVISGCASHKPKPSASATPPPRAPTMIVTPDTSLAAKVVLYNDVGHYVVLSFPTDRMPQVNQIFYVYRNGLKMGEVKISGWQRDSFVVADIVTGEAQKGDDVRSE